MAKGKTSSNAKKTKKAKNSPKVAHDPTKDAPKIIASKGGLTGPQLVNQALVLMEDDLRITKKQAADFSASLIAAAEQAFEKGEPVNFFGLVKLVPRFHTKGVRQVNEEFGNPESKKVTKKYPAKVSIKATIYKRVKDTLPTATVMGKKVGG